MRAHTCARATSDSKTGRVRFRRGSELKFRVKRRGLALTQLRGLNRTLELPSHRRGRTIEPRDGHLKVPSRARWYPRAAPLGKPTERTTSPCVIPYTCGGGGKGGGGGGREREKGRGPRYGHRRTYSSPNRTSYSPLPLEPPPSSELSLPSPCIVS